MANDQLQCPVFVAPHQQCIRFEGHGGRHSAGPVPQDAVCNCPVCGQKFTRFEEFEAHVPCPKP